MEKENKNIEIKWVKTAGLLGALGVILGAFGAHLLASHLEEIGRTSTWQTGVLYHLLHSVALLVLSLVSLKSVNFSLWSWLIGILLFSGSLYALGLGAPNWMGAITPLGGVAFIAGWLALLWAKVSD